MRSMKWLYRGVRTIFTLPIEGVVHECVEGGEVLQVQLFPLQGTATTTIGHKQHDSATRSAERAKEKIKALITRQSSARVNI